MILSELNKNDLLQLLTLFSQESDKMYFIVDKTFKVVYSSYSFDSFVKKDQSQILAYDFGDVLGCGNMLKDDKGCAFTSYCKNCEIRKYLHQLFNKETSKVVFDVVREYTVADETLLRHLQFKMMPINIDKNSYVFCMLDDLYEKDSLEILSKPNALI